MSRDNGEGVEFGFNEWIKAQDGKPKGQDWQTWSAALYLYAAKCVETQKTPFFDEMRTMYYPSVFDYPIFFLIIAISVFSWYGQWEWIVKKAKLFED